MPARAAGPGAHRRRRRPWKPGHTLARVGADLNWGFGEFRIGILAPQITSGKGPWQLIRNRCCRRPPNLARAASLAALDSTALPDRPKERRKDDGGYNRERMRDFLGLLLGASVGALGTYTYLKKPRRRQKRHEDF